jgi:RNA polymerase sigma factor (sigma-70 family)
VTARGDHLVDVLTSNGHAILNYFERRTHRDDAPDLLADVMLVAWRRVDALPDESEPARMWLFGVARNVLLDHQRSTRRRVRLADRVRALASAHETNSPAADENSEVVDAVRRLPPDLRELVVLVHWDGFTLTEAATHLGTNPSTARSRYQRARDQLRSELMPGSALR